jgi:hypothetical protein
MHPQQWLRPYLSFCQILSTDWLKQIARDACFRLGRVLRLRPQQPACISRYASRLHKRHFSGCAAVHGYQLLLAQLSCPWRYIKVIQILTAKRQQCRLGSSALSRE